MKKSILKLLSGNAIVSLSGFLSSIILLRALGLTHYGEFVAKLALLTTVIAFTKFPTWQVLLKSAGSKDASSSFGSALVLDFLLGIFGIVVLVALMQIVNYHLPIVLILLPLFWFRNSTQFPLRLKEKYGYYSAVISLGSIFRLIGYLVLFNYTVEVESFLLVYCFSIYLEEMTFFLIGVFTLSPSITDFRLSLFKGNYQLVSTLYLNASIKSLYRGGDMVLINSLFGPQLTGSFKLIKNSGLIFQLVIDPFYQYFFKKDVQRLNAVSDWSLPFNFGSILMGYFGLNLIGMGLLYFIYNQTGVQHIYFILFNVGFFIQFITIRLQGLLIRQGETWFLSIALMISSLIYFLFIYLAAYSHIVLLYLSWPIFYSIWSFLIINKFKSYASIS